MYDVAIIGAGPAGATLMHGEFRYFSNQGDPNLMWVVVPPFGRRIYHFKDAEWRTLD